MDAIPQCQEVTKYFLSIALLNALTHDFRRLLKIFGIFSVLNLKNRGSLITQISSQ